MASYLLGYDLGSSSVKATLVNSATGEVVGSAFQPKKEMSISSPKSGWAEQKPDKWWSYLKDATQELLTSIRIPKEEITAIGISYQMHGLVVVDKDLQPLRPSIIWCDSRAVEIGNDAFQQLGESFCLEHYLNSPGNFTASKLKWVKENEPDLYSKIYKAMLPGEYIAMRMSGEIQTTISGLSEGIYWDFKQNKIADKLLEFYNLDKSLLPDVVDTFSEQSQLSKSAANELGLAAGTKICYRAGDQPNNAFSLNVLNPGEVAATAGTSGAVYGIIEDPSYDSKSRVNTFVHVNNSVEINRYGVLLCVNGTGILNSWFKNQMLQGQHEYNQMNEMASQVPRGSDGLVVVPFGNGAERILENENPGAQIHHLNFNRHNLSHLLRAGQEGIAASLAYGLDIMKNMGVQTSTIKAGYANMFKSPIFIEAFANMTLASIELYNTDGSQGAARGAGVGAGIYNSMEEAFAGLEVIDIIEPDRSLQQQYEDVYQHWSDCVFKQNEK